MESKELKRMINVHLFVPIEEALANQLCKISELMVATIGVDLVDTYVRSFYHNEVNTFFKRQFRDKYIEQYGEELVLPSVIYIILEIYVVRQAILSDTFDNRTRLNFSYIVKNYAILRKNRCLSVQCGDWILDIYKICSQLSFKPVSCNISFSNLIKSVILSDDWDGTGMDINESSVYSQLRSLSAAGFRDRCNVFIKSEAYQNIASPFLQVYILVYKMVKEWNWKYISSTPVCKLKDVLGDDATKKMNLSKISEIVLGGISSSQIICPKMKSSVILQRLNDNIACSFDKTKFSALEFGVYLYYELILESN